MKEGAFLGMCSWLLPCCPVPAPCSGQTTQGPSASRSSSLASVWKPRVRSLRAPAPKRPRPKGAPLAAPAGKQRDVSRERGWGQMAGNHTSCKQQGSVGRHRKAGTSGCTENLHFGVTSVLEAKEGGKTGI